MAIDINAASAEELAAVPEIGPELAETIIAYREEYGGFDSLDELADLPGFDEQTVMTLREAGANVGVNLEGNSGY